MSRVLRGLLAAGAVLLGACQGICGGLAASVPDGPPPDFACEPVALDFGVRLAGTTALLEVRCESTGDAMPVEIEATGPFHPRLAPSPGEFSALTVPVAFAPGAPGDHEGRLVLRSGERIAGEVVLGGVALDRLLVAEPPSLDFGAIARGASSTLPLSLRNLGTEALGAFLSAPEGRFAVEPSGALAIEPGSTLALQVRYTPGTGIEDEARVTVTPELGPPVSLELRGRARGNASCTFDLRPQGVLDFGARPVGAAATLEAVVINTSGTRCAVLEGARAEGDASFEARGTAVSLPSRGATIVNVRFRPVAAGIFESDLIVPTESGERRLRLRGAGVETCVVAAPDPVDFGTALRGCPGVVRSVLVQNACPEAVNLRSIDVVPSVWPQFEADLLPLPLQIPRSTTLKARFTFTARRAGDATEGGAWFDVDGVRLLVALHGEAEDPPAEGCP